MADYEAATALSPGTEDKMQPDSAAKTSCKRYRVKRKTAFAIAAVIAVLGLILFIIGLVLIVKSQSVGTEKPTVSSEQDGFEEEEIDKCSFSAEAKRVGQWTELVGCFKNRSEYACMPGYSL